VRRPHRLTSGFTDLVVPNEAHGVCKCPCLAAPPLHARPRLRDFGVKAPHKYRCVDADVAVRLLNIITRRSKEPLAMYDESAATDGRAGPLLARASDDLVRAGERRGLGQEARPDRPRGPSRQWRPAHRHPRHRVGVRARLRGRLHTPGLRRGTRLRAHRRRDRVFAPRRPRSSTPTASRSNG
jgi:hypothetical protein